MNKRAVLASVVAISQVVTSCTSKPMAPTSTVAVHSPEKRAPSAEIQGTPWTKWSEKGTVGGLLVIKEMRDDLLKNSLHDAHVDYASDKMVDCSKTATQFRSADGTCNVLEKPWVGAAGVAFGRNVAPQFVVQDGDKRIMEPNPALVSQVFFTRDEFKPVPFLNMLAAVWIQFMNHDWLTHGPNMEKNPYRVQVPGGGERIVDRTKENTTRSGEYKSGFGKVSLNDVTHWWDGSQIYGSSEEQQLALRTRTRGKMRTEVVNGREILPKRNDLNPLNNRQNQGYEMAGFQDNWWVGLSMLTTLFVREHNAIVDQLMKKHVTYNKRTGKFTWRNGWVTKELDEQGLDEQLFQTARLINSAVMAKIHTVEWTPAILPNPTLRRGMYVNWYGILNPTTWSIPGLSKTDWFEATRTGYAFGGIVGDQTRDYGVPYSITEEFTSVYRLHSLLPEKLNFKKLGNAKNVNAVPFENTRNDKSYGFMANNETKDLFYSFGTQLPGQLVLNNYPKFMQDLTIPGHPNMDLGMVDVMRDRERGVPRYNQFRRGIGLVPIRSYRDFFPANKPLDERQQKIIANFERIYGKDQAGNDNVEAIDLLVGTLAEEVRPKSFGFGETMFQIFILMASRRLMADRFFTKDYNKEVYTKTGMDWIDQEGVFAKVIGRHMPELKPKMKGLQTAFEPWRD